MTASTSDGRLGEFSPATREVYETLRARGRLTQTDLVEHTTVSRRTVRSAIEDLRSSGLVTVRPDPTDARRKVYVLEE